MSRIRITDTTLRDGSHAMSHQYAPEQMAAVAQALDRAGVEIIEASHGDGLAGSSYQYGFARAPDHEHLQAIAPVLESSKLAVLLLPGIGTKRELQAAAECGAQVLRVATHCTEADIAEQHIGMGKDLGMEVVGFLMMAHMESSEVLTHQARLMEGYGADVVYVVDSAGALLPPGVQQRVAALKEALSIEVGFHAHNNLGMAIANTIAAIEVGATAVDGTLCGLGAGAGNAQLEVLVAVLDKLGHETGIDLFAVMDAAEDVLRPLMRRPQVIDRASLSLGYAGVYSSFLLHAYRGAERYSVDPREVLLELGRRRTVGGQEDMIIDVAYELAQRKRAAPTAE